MEIEAKSNFCHTIICKDTYLFDRIQFFVFILLLPIKFQQNYLDAFVGKIDKFA